MQKSSIVGISKVLLEKCKHAKERQGRKPCYIVEVQSQLYLKHEKVERDEKIGKY